jgi:hypothetical protein
MMAFLNRVLGANVEPVTHLNTAPAERDPDKERQVKAALSDLSQAKAAIERRSWEIRQEIAGNVLRIVSGE